MSKFQFKVTQNRTDIWVLEVEADSEENARETVLYGFDEDHGFFHEDTEGLTVVDNETVGGSLSFVDTEE